MRACELRDLFIKWFYSQYPNSWIFPNNSGTATFKYKGVTSRVPYGIPIGGGGSDLIAFHPDRPAEFYELKTKNDSMRANQKKFASQAVSRGFNYFVVKQDGESFELKLWSL